MIDDRRRIYERPLARAHALAETWADDKAPITRAEAARLLYEAINPDGWTETDTGQLALVPPTPGPAGVDRLVEIRIADAAQKVAAAQARRAELGARRQAGLAHRHAARLRHQAQRQAAEESTA